MSVPGSVWILGSRVKMDLHMNKILLVFPFFLVALLLYSCEQKTGVHTLSKQEMTDIVKKLDLQFSDGVKKMDSAMLVGIYSENAQYVQPKAAILTGKTEIGRDWAGFLRLKEQPIDLILNIKDVSGTNEIIYETGTGYTLLKDSSRWNFNYVNVWRLQDDQRYKLEIDTYN
jgi:ketosteroid isomerase-like protein